MERHEFVQHPTRRNGVCGWQRDGVAVACQREIADEVHIVAPAVVHAGPPTGGGGLMPCCGRTPFEVPHTDRMTGYSADVTCTRLVDPAAEQPEANAQVMGTKIDTWAIRRNAQDRSMGEASLRHHVALLCDLVDNLRSTLRTTNLVANATMDRLRRERDEADDRAAVLDQEFSKTLEALADEAWQHGANLRSVEDAVHRVRDLPSMDGTALVARDDVLAVLEDITRWPAT